MSWYVFDDASHRRQFLRVRIRNFDVEFFFKRHSEFTLIERIGAKILLEPGCQFDVFFVDSQLFRRYLLNRAFD